MIAKELFLKKYNITEELFQSADMPWEELCDVYEDFDLNKRKKYEDILEEFLNTYLKDVNKDTDEEGVKIHSIRSRVKNPEHLLAKIIRKKQDNQNKYRNLDKSNYEKFITDLIGIRCLVLFKEDWQGFHRYILSKFENNAKYYIKDSLQDFDEDEDHFYIAEKPKVHIRNGDARDIYDEVLSPDSIIDGKVYRSVHYIIKYRGVYLEIQVRTLFEEGWGEIDHAVVYPYYQDDEILKEYTELLNRLSGLADEMSGFFNRLKKLEIKALEKSGSDDDNYAKENQIKKTVTEATGKKEDNGTGNKTESGNTPYKCLQSVMEE